MHKSRAAFSALKKRLAGHDSTGIFRGILTMVAGSGAARLLGVAFIPILTRLYTPDDYGLLALFMSLVAILAPIMTLRYAQAIPLPRHDRIAFNLFALCIVLIATLLAILIAVCVTLGDSILAAFNMRALAQWQWLVLLAVIGAAVYELLSLWATREKAYRDIAVTQFNQSLAGDATKLLLGAFQLHAFGLLFGQFVADTSGSGVFVKRFHASFARLRVAVRPRLMKLLFCHYRDFAAYRLPSQVLMRLSQQAPILIMASLFGQAQTGQLGLAIATLAAPVSLIGQAAGKAYYAEVASLGRHQPRQILRITLQTQGALFMVGIPLAALVALLAPRLFGPVFGSGWIVAGKYAAILSPYVLFQFTSSPLDQVLNVVSRQYMFLLIQGLRATGLVLVYLAAMALAFGATTTVAVLSGYLTAFYLSVSVLIIYIIYGACVAANEPDTADS